MPIGGNALTNPMLWFVSLQIAMGSLILLYLDEIVSKYGLGSGISLFIAAGVSGQLFWQIFQPPISSILGISQGGILWQFLFVTPGLVITITNTGSNRNIFSSSICGRNARKYPN